MKEELLKLFIEEHGKELDNFIFKNLFHKGYYDDFKQEVYLKICNMKVEKLHELFVLDGTLYYAKKICINLWNTKHQSFHKLIRHIGSDYQIPENESIESEDNYIYIPEINETTNDFWVELYKYYVLNKISTKKIAEDLNISKTTIQKRFIEVKQKIKNKYYDTGN